MENSNNKNLTRRDFFKELTKKVVISAGFISLGRYFIIKKPKPKIPQINICDFTTNNTTEIFSVVRSKNTKDAIKLAFEKIGGIEKFISKNDKVLIKVNCGFARPPWMGATTSPEVVQVVASLCLDAGAKEVHIFDNPINNPTMCFDRSGIKEAIKTTSAKIIYPSANLCKYVKVNDKTIGTWPVFIDPLLWADKLINIPIAKTHNLCFASLGMKNLYGFFGGSRNRFHQKIHNTIAELAEFIQPTITILDATRLLIKNGPTGGSINDVIDANTIAISTDIVAIDTFGAEILKIDPKKIRYITLAEKNGVGNSDYKHFKHFVETHL